MSDNKVEKINRIIYVEPNDVYNYQQIDKYGNVENIPMTVPYEDLCVSFNLLVDVFPRFKSKVSSGTAGEIMNNGERKFQLSWTSTDRFTPKENMSFLKGDSFGVDNGESYLTTYYTEISFENYGNNKIVEGLGVESIQVNFESWYTTSVTIKFVDVRGSALFGNEEANHDDGKLTADTIFGCFFTLPYPLFRLQIKGFLGKPVTYQLTCSSFKGNYNSQTGNFEAVANFIGYNYSLLTDIPMEYLISAPFCTYVGREYWKKHVNSSSWALDDGSAPPTLVRFFNLIDRAQKEYNETSNTISSSDSEELSSIANEKRMLRDISENLNSFIKSFKDLSNGYFDEIIDNNRQILFFFEKGNEVVSNSSETMSVSTSVEMKTAFDDLYTSIDSYNKSFVNKPISSDVLPNKWKKCSSMLTTVRSFNITKNTDNSINDISINKLIGERNVDNICKVVFNDNMTLNKAVAKKVFDGTSAPNFNDNIKAFSYLLNLYDLSNIIKERSEALLNREKDVVRRVNRKIEEDIIKVVGFKPYIGNVFKIVMCHLETFIHIMMESANDIYAQAANGMRTPSSLNVIPDKTDIINASYLPPWPGVFNNGSVSNNGGEINQSIDSYAWVGDFSHNFIEEQVVLGFQSAAQRIKDTNENSKNNVKFNYIPIFPSDLNISSSPYGNIYDDTDVSSLAGYIGIRSSQFLGILNNQNTIDTNIVSLLAKIDACNYYAGINSYSIIKNDVFNSLGNNNFTDVLLGISLCDEKYDNMGIYYNETDKSVHSFETCDKTFYNRDRHPILSNSDKNDSYYVFSHYYDEKLISLVPSRINDYKLYKEYFGYNSSENYQNTSFSCIFNEDDNRIEGRNVLYNSDSVKLLTEDKYEYYINKDMFNIFVDSVNVKTIIDKYNELKSSSGGIKIYEYTFTDDLNQVLDKFWKVDNKRYSLFFDGYTNMLSSKIGKLGVGKDRLLPEDNDIKENDNTKDFYNKMKDNQRWLRNQNSVVSINDEGIWKEGNEDSALDNLCVQQFIVNHNVISSGCIFGCPFYYMQNNVWGDETDKGEIADRIRKSKALLFLHTFKYNFKQILNVFDFNKVNGSIECVPYGYLLLLGGLLWRKRYIGKHGKDPIIYKESVYEYKHDNNKTLFVFDGKHYNFETIKVDDVTHDYNVYIWDLFGGTENKWEIDINIENQLVNLFNEFCEKDFARISSVYEISNINDDGNVIEFTYETLIERIREYSKIENCNIKWLNEHINGWVSNYSMITTDTIIPDIFNMLMNENDDKQSLFKNLYTSKSIVIDSNHRRMSKDTGSVTSNDQVIIRKDLHRTYVSSFINQLKSIIDNAESLISNPITALEAPEKLKLDKNLLISMYYYLKNIWDKWLVSAYENDFDVDVFFKKNFIFIDSFYRNTYNILPLNCEKVLKAYTEGDENVSLFSYLNNIISEHHCLFYALPDYIGFDGSTYESDVNLMKDVFRPMSYNSMPVPELSNKFVIIFTSKPSEIADESTNFKRDSFDIWSRSNGTSVAPDIFKTDDLNYNVGNEVTRVGYNVPSFGVSVNRQNNHIFKDIRVDMNNPIATDQSIKAFSNIIEMGKSGERKIMFHGQDTYNIFSSYSFFCEVEMIGNAQICPLMYFQLLNVPMWRGTYMIYNVTHYMTPGNMVTKFKGMKMASRPKPWATSFFSEPTEYKSMDDLEQMIGSESSVKEEYVELNSSYPNSVNPNDYYHMEENRNMVGPTEDTYKNVTIDSELVDLFNKVYDEISMLEENKPVRQWNICLSHALRSFNTEKAPDDGSDHYRGKAIDVRIMRYDKNGETTRYCPSGSPQPEILKVMDILYSNHKTEFSQMILEYKKSDDMSNSGTIYNFNVLHIGSKNGKNKGSNQIFIASGDKNWGSINKGVKSKEWFLNNVPTEFKQIAKKVYYNDKNYFKNFNNYNLFGNYTDSELRAHFGENDFEQFFNKNGLVKGDGNIATRNNNPGNIKWVEKEIWDGEINHDTPKTFVQFNDMYYGARALLVNMNTQIVKGHNTVRNLIKIWAPEVDKNDTNSYIYNVCKGANVTPDTFLYGIHENKNLSIEIGKQIAMVEDHIVLTDECWNKAYDMAVKWTTRKS